MAGFVALAFYVLTRFAGGWGVPYFSFTSERGSSCVNTFTGYTCTPLTLDEVEYYSYVDLPPETRVLSGTYRSTHDYQLDAVIEVAKPDSNEALLRLREAFGRCQPNHPSPLDTTGLRRICVMANDDTVASTGGEPSSRLFTVGTGVRADGTRVVAFQIKSR